MKLPLHLVPVLMEYVDGRMVSRAHPSAPFGSITRTGYRKLHVGGYFVSAHQAVWAWHHGAWPSGMVDHINGVRDDNRIENLRDVTRRVNLENQKRAMSNNRCGYLGVASCSGRPYARIRVHGKHIYLGTFDTVEEAHQAYLAAKRRLHEGNTL